MAYSNKVGSCSICGNNVVHAATQNPKEPQFRCDTCGATPKRPYVRVIEMENPKKVVAPTGGFAVAFLAVPQDEPEVFEGEVIHAEERTRKPGTVHSLVNFKGNHLLPPSSMDLTQPVEVESLSGQV